ncbi:MAG TPA: hypothetical protein VFU47_13550, partial [Armatimonadota bacterium]|nr:hypothetical protein [Armatimonadota bacterium]
VLDRLARELDARYLDALKHGVDGIRPYEPWEISAPDPSRTLRRLNTVRKSTARALRSVRGR